jgi:integrase
MERWINVEEAATFLGRGQNTIISWCKSGKLTNAVPKSFGIRTRWIIPSSSLIAVSELERVPKSHKRPHRELIATYDRYCEQGLIAGRPYSVATRKINKYYLERFLNRYEEASFVNLRSELLEIPIENFAKRYKLWEIMWNFMKWLIAEEYVLEKAEADRIHKLRPKRHQPAKKRVLREDELDKVEEACRTIYETVIVVLLSQTGIRSSEFCSLTMNNIDLRHQEIHFVGKGGKERHIGLTIKAYESLIAYLNEHPVEKNHEPIFKDKYGKPLTRYGLYSRVSTIGDRVGIEVHPHCMRRSFVTINVSKGRSLVHLQLLAGHADITTTRGYCMTSQQEAVDMIKDW